MRECKYCWESDGHNKRTCPKLISRAKIYEIALKKGGYTNFYEMRGDPDSRYNNPAVGDDEINNIDWRHADAFHYVTDQKEKSASRRRSKRRCGFCEGAGHNRRTCKGLAERVVDQAHAISYTHRFVAALLRSSGCTPGAIISKKIDRYDKSWNKHDTITVYGLVTGFDWEYFNLQALQTNPENMPASDIPNRVFRTNAIKVRWDVPNTVIEGEQLKISSMDLKDIALPPNLHKDWENRFLDDSSPMLLVGAANSDKYVVHADGYKGSELEGCPQHWFINMSGWTLRHRKGDKLSDVLLNAGVILGSGTDLYTDPIIGFDERAR
jgi:hypothetical protein